MAFTLVNAQVYNYETYWDYRQPNGYRSCAARCIDTCTLLQTSSCNYGGRTFNMTSNSTYTTQTVFYFAANNPVSTEVNISLNSNFTSLNLVQFVSYPDADNNTPAKIDFYSCLKNDCFSMGNWINPVQTCGHAGSMGENYSEILDNSLYPFDTIKMIIHAKNCTYGNSYRADVSIFNFSYVNLQENHLPDGTFSFNTDFCYNQSLRQDSFKYRLNLNFTDEENDTIYYKFVPASYEDYFISELRIFETLDRRPDYSFFSEEQFSTDNETTFCLDMICTASFLVNWFNIIQRPILVIIPWDFGTIVTDNTTITNVAESLAMSEGTSWHWNLKNPIVYNTEISQILIFPVSPYKLSYFLTDSTGAPLTNVTFYQINDTTLLVYNSSNLLLNFTSDISKNHFRLSAKINSSTRRIDFTLYNTTFTGDNETFATFSAYYPYAHSVTGFTYKAENLYAYYRAYAVLNTFLVSATMPSELTQTNWIQMNNVSDEEIASTFSTKINLYVTDSMHIPANSYKLKTYDFILQDCRFVADELDFSKDFRPDKPVIDTMGNAMQTYYNRMGWMTLAKSALYFVWLALFVFFLIIGWKDHQQIGIVSPILFASGLCLIPALMLKSIQHILTFLILIAFALTPSLARYFNGRGSKEDNV